MMSSVAIDVAGAATTEMTVMKMTVMKTSAPTTRRAGMGETSRQAREAGMAENPTTKSPHMVVEAMMPKKKSLLTWPWTFWYAPASFGGN